MLAKSPLFFDKFISAFSLKFCNILWFRQYIANFDKTLNTFDIAFLHRIRYNGEELQNTIYKEMIIMKLKIQNFRNIPQADILIDGITVIAGENNTGKSTVGQCLFSIFNSFNNIENRILQERLHTIFSQVRHSSLDGLDGLDALQTEIRKIQFQFKRASQDFTKELPITKESIRETLFSAIKSLEEYDEITILKEKIDSILQIEDSMILLKIISQTFQNTFHSQISPLSYEAESPTRLTLEIKQKQIQLEFEKNICTKVDSQLQITNKAIFLNTPFMIDQLNTPFPTEFIQDSTLDLLRNSQSSNSIIEKIQIEKKLQFVVENLQSIVGGDIEKERRFGFVLKNKQFSEPLNISNLSTGVKAFSILKMLLENGQLQNKDVLILDEPEIHLHPQWQIVYAELIVLLQKHFQLSVVITTHSAYFVDAINLYSIKHNTSQSVNYYLSQQAEKGVQLQNVNQSIEKIYEKMAAPIDALDSLRLQLD